MNNELERYGRKRSGSNLRIYLLGTCLEGIRKTTTNLSHERRSPVQNLKPGPIEYGAELLNTAPMSGTTYQLMTKRVIKLNMGLYHFQLY